MSLIVSYSDTPTPKQLVMLDKLGYLGRKDITKQEASEIIAALFEEERLARRDADNDYYDYSQETI